MPMIRQSRQRLRDALRMDLPTSVVITPPTTELTALGLAGVPMPWRLFDEPAPPAPKTAIRHLVPVTPLAGITVPLTLVGVNIPEPQIGVTLVPQHATGVLVPVGEGDYMAETLQIQPTERKHAYFDYDAALTVSEEELVSGVIYASDSTAPKTPATLQSAAVEGATTVALSINPRAGARLELNTAADNAEIVKVTTVAGSSPPFTCTINPVLGFDHTNAEPVLVERGVSAAKLVSQTAEIIGRRAYYTIWHAVHNHTYRVSVVVTKDSGQIDEHEVFWECTDV